ncbi:MAG: hypothetical protein ABIP46_04265 [Polaromonas sp.]
MHRYIDFAKVAAPVFQSTWLLDQLRERIRYFYYSSRTEQTLHLLGGGIHDFHSATAPARHCSACGGIIFGHAGGAAQGIGFHTSASPDRFAFFI